MKRLASSQWNSLNFEHIEKGNLLLAQLHIQSGKFAQAREILDTILSHNAGSWRALELKGLTFEHEKNAPESLKIYQLAWDASSQNNPAIGFRYFIMINFFHHLKLHVHKT